MEEVIYFFDTYAIVEIVRDNQNFEQYAEEDVTLTVFNLAELYWVVLKDYGEEKADRVFEEYREGVVEIDDETVKEAMKFRRAHKKRDLSYADAIGYISIETNIAMSLPNWLQPVGLSWH